LVDDSKLLVYDRRPGEYLGVLNQFPITLGGNPVLIDMVVVNHSLDFNMLIGHDYVYDMNVVVSLLLQVMYFPHNGIIVTIDQLTSDNHQINLNLVQNIQLFAPPNRLNTYPLVDIL